MTTAQHGPTLVSPASGITNESSQSSLHPDPAHSNSAPTPESVNKTVSSVVDGIVENAVSSASIHAEKKNVQALINKLVSQVRDDAINTPPQLSVTPANTQDSPNHTPFAGVPIGDHRQRKCHNLPVTWTQTMDSLTLNVDVPPSVRKQQVSVNFAPGAVKAAVNGDTASADIILFDEPLVAQIAVDGCMWALEEEGRCRRLIIEIEKARMQWWARLFVSDDPAQYTILNPNNTNRPTATSRSDMFAKKRDDVSPAPSSEALTPDLTTDRSAGAEVDSQVPPNSDLEGTVASFIDELVEVAATGSSTTSNRPPSNAVSGTAMNEPRAPRQQRVLTRADIPKMVERCKKIIASAEPGAAESALQLATFYHHGLGVEQDDAEAARLYKYALENGMLDPSAAFQLGLIYNQGAPGLEPDATEAVRWWRLSASLRNPVAMFNLGVMYMNGSGCDMDPIMATRWFQQAQALDPRLQPPQFSRAQLEERIATAMKLRKQRMKRALPPEEKQRRKEEALQKVRVLAYGSAAIIGLGVSAVALRYWWRNRL